LSVKRRFVFIYMLLLLLDGDHRGRMFISS
jgi:hypothetical protein